MKLTSLIFLVALMVPAGNKCCANISDPGPPNLNRLDIPVKVYVNSKVIRVTNLNRKGPGSLREALEANTPRVIVFEVGVL